MNIVRLADGQKVIFLNLDHVVMVEKNYNEEGRFLGLNVYPSTDTGGVDPYLLIGEMAKQLFARLAVESAENE